MPHVTRDRLLSATILAGLLALAPPMARGQTAPVPAAVAIGATDIGGTVTSLHGPEAGVWVIAETTDLPTTYSKIIYTDEASR